MTTRKSLKVTGLIQAGVVQDSSEDRVFGAANGQPLHTADGPTTIAIASIDDSPYQPRIEYDSAEIDNLAHSLATAGLADPIRVRTLRGGRYEILSGHRRVRAARSLGWTTIAAAVVEKDDRQAQLTTMVSNESRLDLSDYERAKLYQEAIAAGFGKTQTDLANLFGASQGKVSRCMAMLKLPNAFLQLLENRPSIFGHHVGETVAQLLREFPGEQELIYAAVRRIADEGAEQKSVRQWVQQMIKAKVEHGVPKARAIVTDRAGREMFIVKPNGREFTVQIRATNLDCKEIEDALLSALRNFAEKSGG